MFIIFKNFIFCLKVLVFKCLILFNFLLCFIVLFFFLYVIIFLVICEFRLDIYCNNDDDVVLILIFIWLIVVLIMKVNVFFSVFWLILCWYCLILIDLGLILINLFNGFWMCCLIDMVFFFFIWKLGNLFLVIFDVEYIEVFVLLIMMNCIGNWCFLIKFVINCFVLWFVVLLLIVINCILYVLIICIKFFFVVFFLEIGGCG